MRIAFKHSRKCFGIQDVVGKHCPLYIKTTRKAFLSSSTYNDAEIKKFTNVDWAAGDGSSSVHELFNMHSTRFKLIRKYLLSKYSLTYDCMLDNAGEGKPFEVLDVGCGGGLLTLSLAELGAKVTSLDPVKENLEATKERLESAGLSKNVTLLQAGIEDMVDCKKKYDIVCSLEVIEHVENQRYFLECCAKVMNKENKAGATLILSTINRTLKSYALAIIAAEYIMKKVPKGTHDWAKFIMPAEVEDVIHQYGLHTDDVRGMVYNPLTGNWHESSTEKDVNYMLFASA